MKDNNMKRVVIVYLILIPVMWLLTETVWGGVHGTLGGIKIGKSFQDPKKLNEVTAFMKKHGISESASKSESKAWIENLSPEDKKEFEKIIMQSVKIEEIVTFGSALAVCVIVFGLIGLISGATTKTWLVVGILPGISFLMNNPVIRFNSILHISDSQKIIMVLIGQVLASYVFAFIGASLCKSREKIKKQKMESLNNGVHTDAE
ncbi:MAG: hypothetical protein FD156_1001 [Nitrospirae bacterium]|nr:MAG: hypothetical protein FD156_1001 [Nitrospirota bacterium]